MALREIKLLQEMDNQNIIKLFDVFFVQKTIFLAMEYLPYDLTSIIKDNKIMLKEEHIKNLML